MKNTLRSSLLSFQHILAAACLGALAVSAQAAPVLITSFEADEGFTSGQVISGVAGWTGSTGDSARSNLAASTLAAYNGTQGIRVSNGANASYNAVSPNLFDYQATTATLWMRNEQVPDFSANTSLARWEVYFGTSSTEPISSGYRVAMVLQYGANEGDDYVLSVQNGGANVAISPNPQNITLAGSAEMDLTAWKEVVMTFDFEGPGRTLNVSVGEYSISSLVTLSANATDNSKITAIRFQTPTDGSGRVFYDYIHVVAVPEPSTWVLITAGAGFLTMVARKRRRH